MNVLPGENWGSGVLDPSIRDWHRENYRWVRRLLHTEGGKPTDKAELFISPNHGATVFDVYDAARDNGQDCHDCLDWHFGNGRDEDGGSFTRSGKYHSGSAEGGGRSAIDRWFRGAPADIKSLEPGNEIPDKPWMANHMAEHIWPYLVAKRNRERPNLILVGHAGEFLGPMSAEFADALDVHSVKSVNGLAAAKILEAKQYGLPVYCFEFAALNLAQTELELRLALKEEPELIGGFCGNRQDFESKKSVRWNFKLHPTFTCWWNGGLTDVGRQWENVFSEPSIPPVDPPPIDPPDPVDPPVEPPPDPGDDVDLGRVRVQNVKARSALDQGKIRVTRGILERQAKALGID